MRSEDKVNSRNFSLNLRGRLISFEKPAVMGILNATPDSFYEGSRKQDVNALLKQAEQMIAEGADILDLGGYSSRPGADEVSQEEEIKRVIPSLEALRKAFPDTALSIDTFREPVARNACNAGADIINDISSGDDDSKMIEFIAETKMPYILMHKKGSPQDMQQDPSYQDVNLEIIRYLSIKVDALRYRGVYDIIVDPGFGFGKTLEHNYAILKHLDLYQALEAPVMAGVSRKSMINNIIGTRPDEALNGTTVLHTLALQKGCNILRVHDVKPAVEAVKLWEYYDRPL